MTRMEFGLSLWSFSLQQSRVVRRFCCLARRSNLAGLVFGGAFDVVDDEDLDGGFAGFEFQA